MEAYPQILLANRKPDRINTLEEYEQSGGYKGLKAAIAEHGEKRVQQMIEDASLLGRGGAAFPPFSPARPDPTPAPSCFCTFQR